jgi:hypothetical protein
MTLNSHSGSLVCRKLESGLPIHASGLDMGVCTSKEGLLHMGRSEFAGRMPSSPRARGQSVRAAYEGCIGNLDEGYPSAHLCSP